MRHYRPVLRFLLAVAVVGSALGQNSITSFVLPNRIPCVAHVDGRQHVVRFFFLDHKWRSDDVTTAAGAPAVLEGSELTSFVLRDGSPHIVFVDHNHHLVQLFYLDKWRSDDLTNAAHAPPAAAQGRGLTSFVMQDGSPHVAFVDGHQHVVQLFFQDNHWRFEDLSSVVQLQGLVLPAGQLTSFVIPDALPQIAFTGENKRVMQLFFQDSKWRLNGLPATPDAPAVGR